jgi:hypothetical protein
MTSAVILVMELSHVRNERPKERQSNQQARPQRLIADIIK